MKLVKQIAAHSTMMIYWIIALALIALSVGGSPSLDARFKLAIPELILAVAFFWIGLKLFEPDDPNRREARSDWKSTGQYASVQQQREMEQSKRETQERLHLQNRGDNHTNM
jgi:hypothetical protein